MSALVTLGNINLGTFKNVCYAVNTLYPRDVSTLLVFDTPESVADDLEAKRNEGVRQIFPDIQIRSQVVAKRDLQTSVPLAMARLLSEFGAANLIVDLTNGQKADTGVLYAVATISRIERIHSLEIKDRRNLGRELPDLETSDWEYTRLAPLKDIDQVAQRCYLELLYYREEIDQATKSIREHNVQFAQEAARLLTQALENYFAGRTDEAKYLTVVTTLGILCEDIARRLFHYCGQSGKTQATATDFNSYVEQIRQVMEPLRGRRVDWGKEGHFGRQMQPILLMDRLLDLARVLRNLVSHPTTFKCRAEEARLMLDIALLVLRRLGETDVLAERRS